MKVSKINFFIVVLLVILVSFDLFGFCLEKTHWQIGMTVSGQHPHALNARKLSEVLSDLSGDTIDLGLSEAVGSDRDIIEQVQLGLLDMGVVAAQTLSSFSSTATALNIPWLFENEDFMFDVVFHQKAGRELLDKIEDEVKDIKCLAIPYYDARFVATTNKKITKIEDFQGLKIRTLQDPAALKMWAELGASPTPIPFNEVYTALITNLVDGFVSNYSCDATMSLYEGYKYILPTYQYNSLDIIIMNEQLYNDLSEDQKEIVLEAADNTVKIMKATIKYELVPVWKKQIVDAGIEITEFSPEFKEKMARVALEAHKPYLENPNVAKFVEDVKVLWMQAKDQYK